MRAGPRPIAERDSCCLPNDSMNYINRPNNTFAGLKVTVISIRLLGDVVELVNTPPFQGGDCGFDPRHPYTEIVELPGHKRRKIWAVTRSR